jgi:hypothetical protein
MQDTMGDVIILNQVKNLGLIDVSGVGPGMENSIGIQRIGLAITVMQSLFGHSAKGLGAGRSPCEQQSLFSAIQRKLKGI